MKLTIKNLFLYLLFVSLLSCESFIEIDPPKNTLIIETVFQDASTVEAAFSNIYYKMREQGMVSGYFGLSASMGSYADELDYFGSTVDLLRLYNHNVTASDGLLSTWWHHAYNLIYVANDIINGVDNAATLTLEEQKQFKGRALFIRAYLHSLLVSVYGDIPYITTINYVENNLAFRIPIKTVYEYIISDLTNAVDLMDGSVAMGERVIPGQMAANALLARIYLYAQNWNKAEETASKLINSYSLEPDISNVFLKNSPETIWQFKPSEISVANTQEGQVLIIAFLPTKGYAITNNLLNAFEPQDLRRTNWVGSITSDDGLVTLHYAHKYKETINTTSASLEYSIIFRLAEQYLIRAEARAHLNNLSGASNDLNAIRNRAGLENAVAATKESLLEAIFRERRVELFTEQGLRWSDLRRTGTAKAYVSPLKAGWRDTDTLLPIPVSELELNPNLKPQNSGY